jgi:hypothetical protein
MKINWRQDPNGTLLVGFARGVSCCGRRRDAFRATIAVDLAASTCAIHKKHDCDLRRVIHYQARIDRDPNSKAIIAVVDDTAPYASLRLTFSTKHVPVLPLPDPPLNLTVNPPSFSTMVQHSLPTSASASASASPIPTSGTPMSATGSVSHDSQLHSGALPSCIGMSLLSGPACLLVVI